MFASDKDKEGRGWFNQDKNSDTDTQVKAGHDNARGVDVTEAIIADRDGSGHQHVAIDDQGNTVHDARVEDR
jgi:hypothetical protein